jgi:hypothetical protein
MQCPQNERVEPEPPIIEDVEDNDDFESVHLNGTTSSEDNDSDDNDIYGIEHDPGFRTPFSSYFINNQDALEGPILHWGHVNQI